MPRQQRDVVVNRLRQWKCPEQDEEKAIGLDAAGLDGFDERVEVGAGIGAGNRITEQHALRLWRVLHNRKNWLFAGSHDGG